MKDTAIEWAENTINFYVGCTKVSEGCANCYMFRLEKRFGRDPSTVRKTNWKTIESHLKNWKSSRIFVNSMSDTFHESLSYQDIQEMFNMMMKYPKHQYLILTKRIERAEHFFNEYNKEFEIPKNFWIGTSVESDKHWSRLHTLYEIKAEVLFASFEPLLSKIGLDSFDSSLDWAIVGGESGYSPRLPKQEWIDDLIGQLITLDVPVFYKQFGGSKKCKCHNAWGCRLWNGQTLDEMPRNKPTLLLFGDAE
jgi:protein gp37